MFAAHLNAAAGPSRLGLHGLQARCLHAPAPSFAARAPRLPAATQTPSPSPGPSSITAPPPLGSLLRARPTPPARAAGAVAPTPMPPPRVLDEARWPFRAIPPRVPGTVEEERVIFSRPTTYNPKIIWPFVVLWLGAVASWFILPKPDGLRRIENKEPIVERTFLGLPLSVASTYAFGGGITLMTLGVAAGLGLPSRFVHRLTQVRRYAPGRAADAHTFVRLEHLGHLVMGGTKQGVPREIKTEFVSVAFVGAHKGARDAFLKLTVAEPAARKTLASRLMDSGTYRLSFAESAALRKTEQEVVLSLARIETVFGRLNDREVGSADRGRAEARRKA
ncbi:hypothetical protein Q5752_002817 [Cryptotrichosporon argae]